MDQLALPVTLEGAGMFTRLAGCEFVNGSIQVRERRGAVRPDVGLVGFFLPGASMLTGVPHRHAERCAPTGCFAVPQLQPCLPSEGQLWAEPTEML